MLGVVPQTRVSGGNRTHQSHANSLAHYSLEKNVNINEFIFKKCVKFNLIEKLVLLENKFNENFFVSQKTWKKRENLANGNAILAIHGRTIKGRCV